MTWSLFRNKNSDPWVFFHPKSSKPINVKYTFTESKQEKIFANNSNTSPKVSKEKIDEHKLTKHDNAIENNTKQKQKVSSYF